MADDIHTIPERTTQKYSFTLQDENAAAIPGASLDTCKLTLYDVASELIINSRDHVDIKANIDVAGRCTFIFVPADNQVLDDSKGFEPHVALFEWTYNSPTGRGQWQLVLNVANAEKVPA